MAEEGDKTIDYFVSLFSDASQAFSAFREYEAVQAKRREDRLKLLEIQAAETKAKAAASEGKPPKPKQQSGNRSVASRNLSKNTTSLNGFLASPSPSTSSPGSAPPSQQTLLPVFTNDSAQVSSRRDASTSSDSSKGGSNEAASTMSQALSSSTPLTAASLAAASLAAASSAQVQMKRFTVKGICVLRQGLKTMPTRSVFQNHVDDGLAVGSSSEEKEGNVQVDTSSKCKFCICVRPYFILCSFFF